MNRNYLIGFAAAIAVLGLFAFAAWNIFEVYPSARQGSLSREARINEYLALDRWLEGMGQGVRLVNSGGVETALSAPERQIFIQASLFSWPEEPDQLVRWVEEGGHLYIALDTLDWHADIETLLAQFGISAADDAGTGGRAAGFPRYDTRLSFEPAPGFFQDGGSLLLRDVRGVIRFAQTPRGRGTFTVSGQPHFLLSRHIAAEPNARLAFAVFSGGGAALAQEGWLFIRGAALTGGLFGLLFRQGNLAVFAVSAAILLVIGFWAAIPVFGVVRDDAPRPGKLLRERFLAEGHFLKRHEALALYQDAYVSEIKRRLAQKEGLNDDEATAFRAALLADAAGRDKKIIMKAFRGEPVMYAEFPKMIAIFQTILERL